jgi:hypothetical protein
MAILSFAWTKDEFLSGKKTVSRRCWKERQLKMWQRLWDSGRLVHEAWDKAPFAGGKRIGKFKLTARPYQERLGDMPESDLIAEGGMCRTLEEFYKLLGKTPEEIVSVIRFEKLQGET